MEVKTEVDIIFLSECLRACPLDVNVLFIFLLIGRNYFQLCVVAIFVKLELVSEHHDRLSIAQLHFISSKISMKHSHLAGGSECSRTLDLLLLILDFRMI